MFIKRTCWQHLRLIIPLAGSCSHISTGAASPLCQSHAECCSLNEPHGSQPRGGWGSRRSYRLYFTPACLTFFEGGWLIDLMLFKCQCDSPDNHILSIFNCISSLLYNIAFFCLGKRTRILGKWRILKSKIIVFLRFKRLIKQNVDFLYICFLQLESWYTYSVRINLHSLTDFCIKGSVRWLDLNAALLCQIITV